MALVAMMMVIVALTRDIRAGADDHQSPGNEQTQR
jgi:hypothetical protein